MSKEFGASIMAQSLSAPLPCWTSNTDVFQRQNDDFASHEDNTICRIGHILGYQDDCDEAIIISRYEHNINIGLHIISYRI